MGSPRFEVTKDKKGRSRWALIGGNGEKIAPSEGYDSPSSMRKTMKNLAATAERAWDRYEREQAKEAKAPKAKVKKIVAKAKKKTVKPKKKARTETPVDNTPEPVLEEV